MLLITHDSSKSVSLLQWNGLAWCEGTKRGRNGWSWARKWQESRGDGGVCVVWCVYGEKSKFGVTHCFVMRWWGWACALINNWLTDSFALGKIFKTECSSVSLQVIHNYISLDGVMIFSTFLCWEFAPWTAGTTVTTCVAAFTALRAQSFGEVLTSAELWAECNLRGSRMKWVQWFVSVQCLLPWHRNKWRWLWCGDGMLGMQRVDRHCQTLAVKALAVELMNICHFLEIILIWTCQKTWGT